MDKIFVYGGIPDVIDKSKPDSYKISKENTIEPTNYIPGNCFEFLHRNFIEHDFDHSQHNHMF